MTKLRRNILPRSTQDLLYTSFAVVMIPTIYWFELFVVIPRTSIHPEDSWIPKFHNLMGTFIFVNIVGNFLAMLFINTSISGVVLQPSRQWKLCSVCEALVPPRSWHCETCNVCILKRDHHCSFCGNCIGYFNRRYFFHFLLYLFVATGYASYFNLCFVYKLSDFNSWLTLVHIVFPLAMLFIDYSLKQLYMFLSLIVLVVFFYSGCLLYFHARLIVKGMVTHERNVLVSYNMSLRENLKETFGEYWCVCWVSPLICSPLPGNGQSFQLTAKSD